LGKKNTIGLQRERESFREREREKKRAGEMSFLLKVFEGPLRSLSQYYRRTVGYELSKYGLRYDDLLDETQNLDVQEALNRLTQEERDMRQQRLKRAMDLSMKHVYLDKETQAKQTPFDHYLSPVLAEVEAEKAEKVALGSDVSYNRQIP
jgi:ubiquinol-cytochrome c reductase subunit 7